MAFFTQPNSSIHKNIYLKRYILLRNLNGAKIVQGFNRGLYYMDKYQFGLGRISGGLASNMR